MFHQKYFDLKIVQEKDVGNFLELYDKAKQIFFDSETSGLGVRWVGRDYLVGLTFAFEDSVSKDVFYIPFRHVFEGKYIGDNRFRFRDVEKDKINFPDFDKSKFEGEFYNVDIVKFFKKFIPIVEKGGKEYIAHHISFDLHLLANEGIDIEQLFDNNTFNDTQIMVHTIDEEQEKNLEAVTEALFGVKKSHYSDTIGTVTPNEKRSVGLSPTANASFQHVQIPIGAQYSAEDVWFMKQMKPSLEQAVKDEGSWEYFSDIRMPYMKVLWKMERNGIKIDVEKLDTMTKKAEQELERLSYRMYELARIKFNIKSGQQIYELLYGWKKRIKDKKNGGYKYSFNQDIIDHHFGFKPVAWTDGGKDLDPFLKNPKTDKDAIKKLFKQNVGNCNAKEFLKTYQDYSKLDKLYTAFMVGLKSNMYCDGKVHPSFNQNGAESGRISSSEPK